MKKFYTLFVSFLFVCSIVAAQSYNRCSTTEYMDMLKKEDPTYSKRLADFDKATEEWIKNNQHQVQRNAGAILTIPVVVHVVYKNSFQNISTAKIQSQIAVLNEDFRRNNANKVNTPSAFQGVAADTEIEFCLAVRDPSGNPTNGITRTSTTAPSFSTNNDIKYSSSGGKDAWPTSDYLNIWVGPLSGNLLGYAQFPGSSSATDGVVILYSAFGRNSPLSPYNLGRTTTHEVGHYLNLVHIWGNSTCGNDQVADTPVQPSSNFNCPSHPKFNNCTGDPTNKDMFMNYMDYTDDACMNLFTNGQKVRMKFAITNLRASLLLSDACSPPTGIDPLNNGNLFELYPNPVSDVINLNIEFTEMLNFNVEVINMLGETISSYNFDNTLGGQFELDMSTLPKGIYFARLKVYDKVYSRKIIKD